MGKQEDLDKLIDFIAFKPQMAMNRDPGPEDTKPTQYMFTDNITKEQNETIWYNFENNKTFVFKGIENNKAKWVNVLDILNITTEDQE